MRANWMEAQYSYSSLEHSLPSLVQWCACESGSNILKWPAHIGYEINVVSIPTCKGTSNI
jgi:hypothetical protein